MRETILDFIRHGKPEGQCTYRGNGIDDPLSEAGWTQMWQALDGQAPWHQVVTSPLARCQLFARALAEKYQLPLKIEERIKEVGFGTWEGRTREEIKANNPDEYKAFYQDPVNNRPAGAEPLDDFFQRVGSACEDIVKRHQGRHILVVVHAGVIRAVMSNLLSIPPAVAYRIKIDNAGITRFGINPSGTHLVFHNRSRL
jgi:alpha-ribazole phosphatase